MDNECSCIPVAKENKIYSICENCYKNKNKQCSQCSLNMDSERTICNKPYCKSCANTYIKNKIKENILSSLINIKSLLNEDLIELENCENIYFKIINKIDTLKYDLDKYQYLLNNF